MLSRPEQMNALGADFFKELPAAIAELEGAAETRAIILAGEGKHFCSGMDLAFFAGEMLDTQSALDRERFRRLVLQMQDALTCIERSRIPVIAAIHGACLGAGVDLISACDMRYATNSAFFCIQEIHLGIMADLGTLQRLPKLMPESIVRELAYTGDRFSTEKAVSTGLVNQAFETQDELMAHVRDLCDRIALRSPLAMAATKDAITYVRDHSVSEALFHAANWQSAIFDKTQILEAIAAQKSKSNLTYENLRPTVLA